MCSFSDDIVVLTTLAPPPDLVELLPEDVVLRHLAERGLLERIPVGHVRRQRPAVRGDGVVDVGGGRRHPGGHHGPAGRHFLHRRVAAARLHGGLVRGEELGRLGRVHSESRIITHTTVERSKWKVHCRDWFCPFARIGTV